MRHNFVKQLGERIDSLTCVRFGIATLKIDTALQAAFREDPVNY